MKPGDAFIIDGETHLVTAVTGREVPAGTYGYDGNTTDPGLPETQVTVLHPNGVSETFTADDLGRWMVSTDWERYHEASMKQRVTEAMELIGRVGHSDRSR